MKMNRNDLKQQIDMLAYVNKNMAEFIKFNNPTLTDTDVSDIATSTIENNIWDRYLNKVEKF